MEIFKESWFIRRLVYAIISVTGVVLFGLGMTSPESFDQIVDSAGPAITLVITAVTAVAARKANPGSDIADGDFGREEAILRGNEYVAERIERGVDVIEQHIEASINSAHNIQDRVNSRIPTLDEIRDMM